MKGKKIDTIFLSKFISECIKNNIVSSDDMIKLAKNKISSIDTQIKKIENLKILRSKLLDIVLTFEDPEKYLKKDAMILSFYMIKNRDICEFICQSIKNNKININNLYNDRHSRIDIIFSIKRLIENKIISKENDIISKDVMFDNYYKFLCE